MTESQFNLQNGFLVRNLVEPLYIPTVIIKVQTNSSKCILYCVYFRLPTIIPALLSWTLAGGALVSYVNQTKQSIDYDMIFI